jgi:hypothetical protein
MGILGLDQLVFFAQFDVDNCSSVLSLSHHPIFGSVIESYPQPTYSIHRTKVESLLKIFFSFPFAICGITITALCKELLFDDMLKNHFYNAMEQPPLTMDHFHQVYCEHAHLAGELSK